MRELRTFYTGGRPYVMPVDIDPDYWDLLNRLYEFEEVGPEFEWVGVHPDELRPVAPAVGPAPLGDEHWEYIVYGSEA